MWNEQRFSLLLVWGIMLIFGISNPSVGSDKDYVYLIYLENRIKKIPTNKLNKVLLPIIENFPPPAVKGKYIKIKFITMLPTYKPTFVFYCSHPKYVKEQYKRFVENKIRDNFDFKGVPIQVFFRQK